ncbi:hypothetical protein ADUPG1_009378 [Aduncisulcus paluster]|uniref:HTH cro/C1-type domain-containing protein n=1 Tax=Aduncisulcus paluster TaxID=2918883 RepID=A0ABQ5KVC6_9EUKA|nr:hypothetical protein ADUPG1_009378 [Aduncisulcus paluster]
MDHQDWKKTVITKPGVVSKKKPVGTKKASAGNKAHGDPEAARLRKIEETDDFEIKRVTKDLGKRMAEGRAVKKWTQDDLAKRCSLKKQVITEYENGKARPVEADIRRIEKALNWHIRGGKMGPLHPVKKEGEK